MERDDFDVDLDFDPSLQSLLAGVGREERIVQRQLGTLYATRTLNSSEFAVPVQPCCNSRAKDSELHASSIAAEMI